jgi:hypothetical protein
MFKIVIFIIIVIFFIYGGNKATAEGTLVQKQNIMFCAEGKEVMDWLKETGYEKLITGMGVNVAVQQKTYDVIYAKPDSVVWVSFFPTVEKACFITSMEKSIDFGKIKLAPAADPNDKKS